MVTLIVVGVVLALASLAAGLRMASTRSASPREMVPPAPRIAASVLTAAGHKQPTVAREVEAAMAQAVRDCLASGVSMKDSATIRRAVLAARARVLAQR